MSQARVLVVDDETLIRRVMSDYLSEYDYEVETAADGLEGLTLARASRFDVMLIDLRMPKMDGLEVIAALSAEQPELPIVVVSGTGVLNDAIEAVRLGAWDYVTKPVRDMNEIVVVVERVLEKSRLLAERDRYQQALEDLNRSLEAEVARQTRDLRVQNRELLALNHVSYAISDPLDMDTMLRRAIEAAVSAIEADGGVIRLLDAPGQQLVVAASSGIPEPCLASCHSVPFAPLPGHETGSAWLSDLNSAPWMVELAQAGAFRSYLCVPLRANEPLKSVSMPVGTLEILVRAERSFDAHEVELLISIGNQIGVAVARAQYAADLERANVQLEALLTQVQAQASRVQQIVDTVPQGVLLLDADGRIVLANPLAQRDLRILAPLPEGDDSDPYQLYTQVSLPGLGDQLLVDLLLPPPQGLWHQVAVEGKRFEIIARPIEQGAISGGWVMVIRDVTQEREIERRVQQQERLAAIGQLAAGIAHDFNNHLTAINGYSELLLLSLSAKDSRRADLEEIKKAARRSASLTRQLLAFSRKQIIQPRVINLNDVVVDIDKMLQRLIGENIELIVRLDPALGSVEADPGQIDQVLVNLVVNARDAMPDSGQLIVETANVNLDHQFVSRHTDLLPGAYVMLSVTDTGVGMDEETQLHLFEPFFTTKERGKGTGLGLATVYGIVKQSGGSIWAYSELGHGSVFKIYLPRVDSKPVSLSSERVSVNPLQGTETLLLVEDDDAVRELAQRVLQRYQYQVIVAEDARRALDYALTTREHIDMLITDVIMPEVSGRDLSVQLAQVCPDIRVLFMSGYTDEVIVHHGVLDPGVHFIQKPFTALAFLHKVRQVLDEPALDESVTDEPALDGPALDGPALDGPALDESVTDEPVTKKPVTITHKE